MKLVFLVSSLRSGSHMIRSMLREDAVVIPNVEHTLANTDLAEKAHKLGKDMLVPMKYGHANLVEQCLEIDTITDARMLLLHRRDARAQAKSLRYAQVNKAWTSKPANPKSVTVDDEFIKWVEDRNKRDSEKLVLLKTLKVVLAYEDITLQSVTDAMKVLFERDVIVMEPNTVKLGGYDG